MRLSGRFRLMFAGLLTACVVLIAAGSSSDAQGGPSWPPPGRRYLVALAMETTEDPRRVAQARDLEQALAAYPFIHFVHTDAQGRRSRHLMNIDSLAAQGVDVLVVTPDDTDMLARTLANVNRRGVPMVLLDRGLSGNPFGVVVRVDEDSLANNAAKRLVERLGGKGRVLVLRDSASPLTRGRRTETFVKTLKAHAGMDIAADLRTNGHPASGGEAVADALGRQVRFDAIYAEGPGLASGALRALIIAGIDPATVPVVAIGLDDDAREAIDAGRQDAAFAYPSLGEAAAAAVLDILRGRAVPPEVMVPAPLVVRQESDPEDSEDAEEDPEPGR